MHLTLSTSLVAAMLLQNTLPTHSEPLRNTFLTAAESVIDQTSALEIRGDDDRFRSGMQLVLAAKANLVRMVEDDREQGIADATNDLVFAVQACHLQAKNNVTTDKCEAQVGSARLRAMDALGRHKSNGAWVNGPPAR